ncbi:MAG: GNAT family N-acetyltransferase [bacterium]
MTVLRIEIEEIKNYIFIRAVKPKETKIIRQIETLLYHFRQIGVIPTKFERLVELAKNGFLFVAFAREHFVGCSAITAEYPDGSFEFGSWAVHTSFQRGGIGKHLLEQTLLVEKLEGKKVIAVANSNSAPIFKKMGYELISQNNVHQDFFNFCQICSCPNKDKLNNGQKCVDKFFLLQNAVH